MANNEKTNEEILQSIYLDVQQLKKDISAQMVDGLLSGIWMRRQQVMDLLEYGDTQMAALDKKGILVISKVGKRKFYSKDSVLKLLEASKT